MMRFKDMEEKVKLLQKAAESFEREEEGQGIFDVGYF